MRTLQLWLERFIRRYGKVLPQWLTKHSCHLLSKKQFQKSTFLNTFHQPICRHFLHFTRFRYAIDVGLKILNILLRCFSIFTLNQRFKYYISVLEDLCLVSLTPLNEKRFCLMETIWNQWHNLSTDEKSLKRTSLIGMKIEITFKWVCWVLSNSELIFYCVKCPHRFDWFILNWLISFTLTV